MNRRIRLLVVVHAIAGIALSGWAAQEGSIPFVLSQILLVPPFALALCQSGLLALWAAMSHGAIWKRAVGLVAGVIALEVLLAWALDEDEFTSMPAMATGLVTAALAIIRRWRTELRSVSGQPNQGKRDGFQFSIRGLMLLTLLVAIFISIGKQTRQVGVDASILLLIRSALALCFAVTNLLGIWAAMGLDSFRLRSAAVTVLSVPIALAFGWCLGIDGEAWFYVTAIMVLEIMLLLASLLVVRSSGYRLVPYPTNQRIEPQQDDSDRGVT